MVDVIHLDRHGNESSRRMLEYTIDPLSYQEYNKPRVLRCLNGHETSGEYVQTIGGHSYCARCLAAMLDAFGARVREVA